MILQVLKMLVQAQLLLYAKVKYEVGFKCVRNSLYMHSLLYVFKYLTCAKKKKKSCNSLLTKMLLKEAKKEILQLLSLC